MNRQIIIIIFTVVIISIVGLNSGKCQLADSPWPKFRHDLQNTGQSPYSGPQMPGRILKHHTNAAIESSPAIGIDGTIYFGTYHRLNGLFAIVPYGLLKWRGACKGAIVSSPAIGPDGTIYIGVMNNNKGLHAINPDGTFKDIFDTHGDVFSSAAITLDNIIIVGSRDKNLYAFNPDGSKKWNFPTGDSIDSSPAIGADGKIYFSSVDSFVYCLRHDGTLKWKYKTGGGIISSPAIGKDGQLYIGSNDGTLYAFLGDHRGPLKEITVDSLNLDDDAGFWGIYCERTPEWIMENVSEPSLDGTTLHCGITGGDMSYSNVHCYRNLPAQADKDSFYMSLYFQFDKTTYNDNNSIIQALEFTMNKWQDGKRYEWALQWQNVGDGAPQWRYWDPHQNEKWISLGIKDSLEAETWHYLEMIGKIDKIDQVHYLQFTIDTREFNIDSLTIDPVVGPNETDRSAIAFQLDGTKSMSLYNVYFDLVNFYRLKTGIKFPQKVNSTVVKNYSLEQNYPNPFNPSTTINFILPRESEVLLKIFNIKGELVCTLEQKKLPRGNHSVTWNGQDSRGQQCPSGIYFCQLKAASFLSVRKLTLLR